jgi:hypothetical protein
MKEKIKDFFLALLNQDMAKQARQVEIVMLGVFLLLLATFGWFWYYQIELSELRDGQRVPIGKYNIVQILLSKRGE